MSSSSSRSSGSGRWTTWRGGTHIKKVRYNTESILAIAEVIGLIFAPKSVKTQPSTSTWVVADRNISDSLYPGLLEAPCRQRQGQLGPLQATTASAGAAADVGGPSWACCWLQQLQQRCCYYRSSCWSSLWAAEPAGPVGSSNCKRRRRQWKKVRFLCFSFWWRVKIRSNIWVEGWDLFHNPTLMLYYEITN